MARTKRRSLNTRADPSRGSSAALPIRESGPPYTDRRGPRCAPRGKTAGPQPPPNQRRPAGGGSARRGAETPPLGSCAQRALGRAAWPPAPRDRGLAPKPSGRRRARGPALLSPRLRSDRPPPAEARSSNTRSPRSPPTPYRFTMVVAQSHADRLRLALTREPPARLGSPSCAA